MTIDERLDRLTERHEALTQTVELIAHNGMQQDQRIKKILLAIETDAENIRALARIAATTSRFNRLGRNTKLKAPASLFHNEM